MWEEYIISEYHCPIIVYYPDSPGVPGIWFSYVVYPQPTPIEKVAVLGYN
jgi:hypothetical protein